MSTINWIASLISSGIIMLVIVRIWFYRKNTAMKPLADNSIVIIISALTLNVFLSLNYTPYIQENFKELTSSIILIGYAVYFVFWIVGFKTFLRRIVRLPSKRRKQFNIISKLMNLQVVLILGTTYMTSGLVPAYNELENSLLITRLLQILMSQIAIVTFSYFYRALSREQKKNASKLIKARLQLMKYSILTQILLSISYLVGAVLITTEIFNVSLVFIYMFLFSNLTTVIFSLIIYSSINIPERVRIAYNISPNRFKYIRQATS